MVGDVLAGLTRTVVLIQNLEGGLEVAPHGELERLPLGRGLLAEPAGRDQPGGDQRRRAQ